MCVSRGGISKISDQPKEEAQYLYNKSKISNNYIMNFFIKTIDEVNKRMYNGMYQQVVYRF